MIPDLILFIKVFKSLRQIFGAKKYAEVKKVLIAFLFLF